MSATFLGSVSDLNHFFQDHERAATLAVTLPLSVDGAPALVARARAAYEGGRPVRILGPDGVGARRLAALAEAAGLPAGTVLSLREAALAIIAGADDAAGTGARRLLDGNEQDVLMEDLKVSGIKPGRLREMMKFFAKGIAEGASHDADWLISLEEQRQFAILTENLEARGALLPVAVYDAALTALNTPGGAEAARAIADGDTLLIVDGFHTASARGQALVAALAPGTLIVCGSPLAATNSEEDYPSLAGFTALAETAEAAAVVEFAPVVREETVTAPHPAAEFDAVAATVRAAVEAGTDPTAIAVACPHPIWMDAIATRLAAAGIPIAVDGGPAKVKGDPRLPERCGRLRTRALAKLLRDPNDFTALRSWLGLGDWLLRSDAFLELLAWARDHGTTAPAALCRLAALPDSERGCELFAKFDEPLNRLTALEGALADASGPAAVATLEEAGCELAPGERAALEAADVFDNAAFAALVLDGEGAEDPDGTAGADAPGAVALFPYRRAFGRHGRLTVICGAVSGFLPALDATSDRQTVDHRRRAYDRDRLLFETLKATADERVVLTRFTDDRIENADALGLDVGRVYAEDGLRYAAVKPSPYLTDESPIPDAPAVQTRVSAIATF